MTGSLIHRCDASPSGSESATVAWIRTWDGAEILLCVHHAAQHGKSLADAQFLPVLIGDTGGHP